MRFIDDIIKVVIEHDRISTVHKQVLINRINKEPNQEELSRAQKDLEKTDYKLSTVIQGNEFL